MSLRLYNTLTRTKEDFVPLDAAYVRLYVCGPTVYDRAHIGNARPLIVFDVLYRLLRHIYGVDHVAYVRNITDVDDKINARAAERGVSIRDLTEDTTRAFHEDVEELGCLTPDVEPRATDHIAEMKEMIERLVAREIAYVAEGHVLFSVAAMDARGKRPPYGELSRRSLDELIAGARVEVAPYKREPVDFVLWKPSKPGEPAWESPCGIATPGRPGWHIECSAMSYKHLVQAFVGRIACEPEHRNAFDIHGGGLDLIFPHHENEIAQTCCALDTPVMAKVWMHNGFLQVEGKKMAKSAGNFVTIHDLLRTTNFGGRTWSGEVLRLAMLRTHYTQPIDFTLRALEEAERTLGDWKAIAVPMVARAERPSEVVPRPLYPPILEAFEDDLNTPAAIAEMHKLRQKVVRDQDDASSVAFSDAFRFFGFLSDSVTQALEMTSEQKQLFDRRIQARAAKNWAESDRIRDILSDMGVTLKDNKDGTTTWEVKR